MYTLSLWVCVVLCMWERDLSSLPLCVYLLLPLSMWPVVFVFLSLSLSFWPSAHVSLHSDVRRISLCMVYLSLPLDGSLYVSLSLSVSVSHRVSDSLFLCVPLSLLCVHVVLWEFTSSSYSACLCGSVILCMSHSLFLCACTCLSVCPSICLHICLSLCLLFVSISFCVYLPISCMDNLCGHMCC